MVFFSLSMEKEKGFKRIAAARNYARKNRLDGNSIQLNRAAWNGFAW